MKDKSLELKTIWRTLHCQQKICDSLDLANEFAGFRHLFAKFVQKNKITSFRNKIDFPEKEI